MPLVAFLALAIIDLFKEVIAIVKCVSNVCVRANYTILWYYSFAL